MQNKVLRFTLQQALLSAVLRSCSPSSLSSPFSLFYFSPLPPLSPPLPLPSSTSPLSFPSSLWFLCDINLFLLLAKFVKKNLVPKALGQSSAVSIAIFVRLFRPTFVLHFVHFRSHAHQQQHHLCCMWNKYDSSNNNDSSTAITTAHATIHKWFVLLPLFQYTAGQ